MERTSFKVGQLSQKKIYLFFIWWRHSPFHSFCIVAHNLILALIPWSTVYIYIYICSSHLTNSNTDFTLDQWFLSKKSWVQYPKKKLYINSYVTLHSLCIVYKESWVEYPKFFLTSFCFPFILRHSYIYIYIATISPFQTYNHYHGFNLNYFSSSSFFVVRPALKIVNGFHGFKSKGRYFFFRSFYSLQQ